MDLKDLYRDVIVDHNRNPRTFRPMPDAVLVMMNAKEESSLKK